MRDICMIILMQDNREEHMCGATPPSTAHRAALHTFKRSDRIEMVTILYLGTSDLSLSYVACTAHVMKACMSSKLVESVQGPPS